MKKEEGTRMLRIIFWSLVGVFVLMVSGMLTPMFEAYMIFFLFGSWTAFFVLGIALIVLTLKRRVKGKLKVFLLLTGISAAAFLISLILHNALYALGIYFFGENFWANFGGDEPLFFIIAVFVCPIAFLVGAIGSIVLFKKEKKK